MLRNAVSDGRCRPGTLWTPGPPWKSMWALTPPTDALALDVADASDGRSIPMAWFALDSYGVQWFLVGSYGLVCCGFLWNPIAVLALVCSLE